MPNLLQLMDLSSDLSAEESPNKRPKLLKPTPMVFVHNSTVRDFCPLDREGAQNPKPDNSDEILKPTPIRVSDYCSDAEKKHKSSKRDRPLQVCG